MSVNSKMTAIAEKIRALLGISGTMGLDAMATNLGTEQTNVTNAFTAVGNKGGTVPTSKVSGNLASAINSIPSGVTIQKKTGTIRTNSSGSASVTGLGFKPDIVAFDGGTDLSGGYVYAGVMFTEAGRSQLNIVLPPPTNYFLTNGQVTQTSNGFSVSLAKVKNDMSYAADSYRSISYVAIKYT